METLRIREEVTRLGQELEDLEAEEKYTLGQRGVHLLRTEVDEIRENYESQINAVKTKISDLNEILGIREEIVKLEQEVDDLEAEKKYTLGQTGVHISRMEIENIKENYASQIDPIKHKISELNQKISVI